MAACLSGAWVQGLPLTVSVCGMGDKITALLCRATEITLRGLGTVSDVPRDVQFLQGLCFLSPEERQGSADQGCSPALQAKPCQDSPTARQLPCGRPTAAPLPAMTSRSFPLALL